MSSRLDRIADWKRMARRAGYKVDRLARNAGVTERQLERYFGVGIGPKSSTRVAAGRPS